MILQIIDGEILAESLQSLAKGVAGKVVRGVLAEGIGPMVPAMRSKIHSVTGLLAGGLKLKMGKGDRAGRYSVYVDSTVTARKFEAKKHRPAGAGSPGRQYRVYYGALVEFGHRIAGSDERVPAHPFMRTVFDAQVETAAETIENGFWDAVETTI
jgi:hypothetical protein